MIVIGINHAWTVGCQAKASELAVRLDETRTEVEPIEWTSTLNR